MKEKPEVISITFDIEIRYNSDAARAEAIKEASRYFKRTCSSAGYSIDADNVVGRMNEPK